MPDATSMLTVTAHWTTPLAIAVLERLLGAAGKPGGALLSAWAQTDRAEPN